MTDTRILAALLKARSALANRDLVPRVVSIVCPACGLDHRSIEAIHGEERFNPHHDPRSGRCSSGAGGGRHEDHPDLKDLAETLKDDLNENDRDYVRQQKELAQEHKQNLKEAEDQDERDQLEIDYQEAKATLEEERLEGAKSIKN